MIGLVGRRLAWSVAILLMASRALFVFVRATTDPLSTVRAGLAADTGGAGHEADRAVIDPEEKRPGLDRPLASQYASWLGHSVQGDWGESSVSRRSVGAEIRQRPWYTTQLVVLAILLALQVAVVVGVVSASRPGSVVDHLLSA